MCNPLRHAVPYQFKYIEAEPIVVLLQLAHTTYNLYDNLVYIDKYKVYNDIFLNTWHMMYGNTR